MKLPSLWPAVFFAGGILLSGKLAGFGHGAPIWFVITPALVLLPAFLFLHYNLIRTAALFGACVWLSLGFAASKLESTAVPRNLVSTMIDSGKLDSSVPLRWRGRLRTDPLRLPWGTRYEIELDQVESSGGTTPVSGGLRLTLYQEEAKPSFPPPARAGDRVEAFVRAVTIHNFGNPGMFDNRSFLARQGIHVQATLRNAQLLTVDASAHLSIADRLARARGNLLASLDNLLGYAPAEAALARAMLLGDRSFVEQDRIVEFQRTGVYHVLVLAGLHVGALVFFFVWAGRRLHLALLPRTILTLTALAAYAGVVQDRPPILRAALMAAIFLFARLLYRRMDLLNVVSLAALGILAARPSEITDASFLLSISAAAIIAALGVPWLAISSDPYRKGLSRLTDVARDVSFAPRVIQFRMEVRAAAKWFSARLPAPIAGETSALAVVPLRSILILWELVVVSTVLQLGMLPLLAFYFHRVTLAGPLANIPAVLLTGLIVPLGFLTLALSLVSRTLAIALAKPLALLLTMLDRTVHWFSRWQGTSYRIPGPPLLLIGAFFIFAIALSAGMKRRSRAWQCIGASLVFATAIVIATHPFAPQVQGKYLEVTVLDVGQGDSIFISFPGGQTMMVDGGGELGNFRGGGMHAGLDTGEDVVSPYLWSRGLKTVDVVALTHAHLDHLGGLPAILENFHVRELWLGRDIPSESFRHLLEVAEARGVRVVHLKQGDSFSRETISGSVLWPESLEEEKAAKNDDSLVMRLTDGSQSMLLAGDIERPAERKLLAENKVVGSSFLKIGHHGSKTSTTDPFLSEVHPAFAAISVGRDNSFGHPSPEVTDRLAAAGVHVYRTDRDGAITAVTDGHTLTVSTFLPVIAQTAGTSSAPQHQNNQH